jgi:hypothetical protein
MIGFEEGEASEDRARHHETETKGEFRTTNETRFNLSNLLGGMSRVLKRERATRMNRGVPTSR